MKTISLKLPDALESRLSAEVAERGVSKSELVREALESYLTRSVESRPASFLELAGDLAGCVEGPEDLSSDPKHLAGYGA